MSRSDGKRSLKSALLRPARPPRHLYYYWTTTIIANITSITMHWSRRQSGFVSSILTFEFCAPKLQAYP
eukprot:5631618-Heterocapsa_arctica.AAC.1